MPVSGQLFMGLPTRCVCQPQILNQTGNRSRKELPSGPGSVHGELPAEGAKRQRDAGPCLEQTPTPACS